MPTTTSTPTVNDWFAEWTDTYKSRRVKQGTLRNYRAIYGAYIGSVIGESRLSDITPEELQHLLNNLADKNYSEATIGLVTSVLSGMFKAAARTGHVPASPASLIECPRGRRTEHHKALTAEEQSLFMTYAVHSPLSGFFRLAICTGMRYGELAGLLWGDVDLTARLLHVRHNLVKTKGGYVLDTPKTHSSRRDIPLVGHAHRVLLREAATHDRIRDDAFLFGNGTVPVTYDMVRRELDGIKRRILHDGGDFPYAFTFHGTRDSFATRCVESGMSLTTLRDILGHSTIRQTEVYAQNFPDTLIAAMNAVSTAF